MGCTPSISTHIIYLIYRLYVYYLLHTINFYRFYIKYSPIFKPEDYGSFYNTKLFRLNYLSSEFCKYNYQVYNKYSNLRLLIYEYREQDTGYLIQEEQFITTNNRLFYNIYDAIKYEYGIDLLTRAFDYI